MEWPDIVGAAAGTAAVVAAIVVPVVIRRKGRLDEQLSQEAARCTRELDELLNPLDGYFAQSKRIADELRGDLADLEYPHIVGYFDGLPADDPRKLDWRQRIERLHKLNSDATVLISPNAALPRKTSNANLMHLRRMR